MTNFEKYKDEILELSKIGTIAVNKQKNMPVHCSTTPCSECILRSDTCTSQLINWLYEEYQEPAPKLAKAEKGFCEILDDGYIARDKNGELHLYNNPPYVTETDWRECGHCTKLCSNFFPFITWESGKAWNINELLALEVEE